LSSHASAMEGGAVEIARVDSGVAGGFLGSESPGDAVLPKSDGLAEVKWIDQPGNNLKLGAYILAPVSAATLATGVAFLIMQAQHKPSQVPYSCSGIMFCGFGYSLGEGMGSAVRTGVGIGSSVVGVVTGAIAIGLYFGGDSIAKAAEKESQKRIEISPYVNPTFGGGDKMASAAGAPDGAVLGVAGRF